LQQGHLGKFGRSPSTAKLSRQAIHAFIRAWHRRGMCPACEVAIEHAKHALATLLTSWPDGDFVHHFDASGGLCLPHVARLIEQHASSPALSAVLEAQRRHYARLVADLEEFSRKHNYRRADSAWGSESDSWLRAIAMLTGKPGVHGTDLHRRPSAGAPQRWWQGFIERLSTIWGGS
jgi:hypothetical protein